MKKVTYSGDSFVTTDAAAAALVDFAAALAHHKASESVILPVVDARGNLAEVRLLVGPSSELICVPEDSPFDEPDVAAAVADLEARTVAMEADARPATAQPYASVPPGLDIADQL
jgi:hypothetical protein